MFTPFPCDALAFPLSLLHRSRHIFSRLHSVIKDMDEDLSEIKLRGASAFGSRSDGFFPSPLKKTSRKVSAKKAGAVKKKSEQFKPSNCASEVSQKAFLDIIVACELYAPEKRTEQDIQELF